jgi:hypothetical protein
MFLFFFSNFFILFKINKHLKKKMRKFLSTPLKDKHSDDGENTQVSP